MQYNEEQPKQHQFMQHMASKIGKSFKTLRHIPVNLDKNKLQFSLQVKLNFKFQGSKNIQNGTKFSVSVIKVQW